MNIGRVIVILCFAVFGGAVSASTSEAGVGYMGIQIDGAPLPPLVMRHLRLAPGEGLRVVNVQAGSPADKAGLERDDIIVAVQEKKVRGHEAFIDAVHGAGAGADISLKIIQAGERKTVRMVLAGADEMQGQPWKYAAEPEPVESWQPGRMWFMEPGDKDWSEVPWRELLRTPTPGGRRDVTRLFKEIYTFRHDDDGRSCTITVEGDPADEEAWIIVRAEEIEYKVMAKDADELPEQYREPARDALRRAQEQKAQRTDSFKLPRVPNLKREDIFENLRNIRPPAVTREDVDKVVERVQQQMQQLQKEMEKLQRDQKDLFERWRENRRSDAERGA